MKKIILVAFAALLLGGCQAKTNTQAPVPIKEDQKDVFTSIKDAMTKQLILKCDYTSDKNEKMTIYLKGQIVRIEGTGTQANVEGLLRDNKFYLWDKVKKEGMELDMAKVTASGSMSIGDKKITSVDDVVTVLEEKKENCAISPESANLLEVPTDVKFLSGADFLSK
jgi:PBP1b-binding outer membrane lipoprotein LpoB